MPPLADLANPVPVKVEGWPQPRPRGFSLTPQVTLWVEATTVPEGLESLVFNKLGDTAWQRFRDFSKWPDGWAGPGSQAVAWGTYLNFGRLLDGLRVPTGRTPPSLFVTDEGFLSLQWEARDGTTVSVTVSSVGAEFYIESEGAEGAGHDLDALALRLNRTWA